MKAWTLFLAALVLAGCAAPGEPSPSASQAPTVTPPAEDPTPRTVLDESFSTASGPVVLTFELDEPSVGTLRLELGSGARTDLKVDGPGACDVDESGASSVGVQPGAAYERECGSLEAGTHEVRIEATGVATGRVLVTVQ